MTFRIGSIEIVIFKVTKLETVNLSFDKKQAEKDALEIIESESFQELREKAQTARLIRQAG